MFFSAVRITDHPPWTQPREFEKEETKISRDTAPSKDEGAASQPSDAPAKNTRERAAETVENDMTASSGPEIESQREANDAESQQALGEQGKADAVVAPGIVETAPGAGEPGEKSSSYPLGYDVVAEKIANGVEKDTEESNLTSEKLGQEKGSSQDVQETGNKEGQITTHHKAKGGYGDDYHPAKLHPPPPGASATEYQTSLGTQHEEQDSPTARTGKQASVGAEKKLGFITMVKGEMKILAGKMRGDEHKVEEGKKIVHGEA